MNRATILTPLDGTTGALAALPVARALAGLAGGVLHLIHVGGTKGTPLEPAELGLTAGDLRGARLTRESGEPAEQIVRRAVEELSAYIVLTTHTRPTPHGRALGPVARQILSTAPCPVVLVPSAREPAEWIPRHLVLPHDGSPATAAALAPAADLAQRSGAELHVVHIAAATPAQASPGTLQAPRYLDQPQHEWGAWAREFLERMSALGGGTSLRLHLSVAAGEPGEEIVRFAREHRADLIVLASSGHWEPARAAALRSVIEHSDAPVLIVRAGAQPAEPAAPA